MKGICFKEPMFLKVVAGEKTMTRRIMKPQPNMIKGYILEHSTQFKAYNWLLKKLIGTDPDRYEVVQGFRSRYKVGEVVYLKEPYIPLTGLCPVYRYGEDLIPIFEKNCWRNKLFMPEKYARYYIKITDVKVERLIEISKADAIAEGMTPKEAFTQFANTWKEIHGVDSWADNPWVWKYTFELTNKH
jgi:hypothetical protein